MKKILNTILILVLLIGSTSCSEWLNVNTDPNNPTETSAEVNIRLPWIQHYYMYAWGNASMRGSTIAGLYTQTSRTSTNGLMASWNPTQSICTTAYQNWMLGGYTNIDPMIEKAQVSGSTHYIAAAYIIKSMGFFLMLDIHGEMPYTEAAASGVYSPKYDQGETIYNGCMADLDKAIELLSEPQPGTGAIPLSKGDSWNGGDVDKWIKLAYGLKARYLLQISKKSTYDGDAVLAALANAPKSIEESTIMKHYNVSGDQTNVTIGDPYQANSTWNSLAYGTTQRATRWYANLLTNSYTGGSKVIDPRHSKLLPAIMTNIVADENGNVISNDWRRDVGIDNIHADTRVQGSVFNTSYAAVPVEVKYTIEDATAREEFVSNLNQEYTVSGSEVVVTYPKGSMYINSTDYRRAADTLYVNMRANSMSTSGKSETDMYYYINAAAGAVAGSGTFFVRPNSDSDILTYSEMCFIEAEVYMRKGDNAKAHEAYLRGVESSFERMQTKLSEWKGEGTINPDQMPMDEADIAAYMASDAVVQSPASMTMFELIKQKIIAMGPHTQVWNDMRRLNYSAGNIGNFGVIYVDYDRPADFTATNKLTGTSKTDDTYWFRRYSQSTHESNYNSTNLLESHPLAMEDPIWSAPVWWDIAE